MTEPTNEQRAAQAATAIKEQAAIASALKLDEAAIAKALLLEEIRKENAIRSNDYYKSFLLPMLLGLFASLPPTIGALAAGIVMWLSLQSKVDKYHGEVNHMKDELVASVRQASRAEGVIEGKAQSRP